MKEERKAGKQGRGREEKKENGGGGLECQQTLLPLLESTSADFEL